MKPHLLRQEGRIRWIGFLSGAVLLAAGLVVFAGEEAPEAPAAEAPVDPLTARGLRATTGAAPGYVDDKACRLCHTDLYDSYQEVGMARSFYAAKAEAANEDFNAEPYFHAPSDNHYQIFLKDGGYHFRRWQEDAQGRPINVVEEEIEWILGSGNHSRTYLYRAGSELFQLPLAWYSQPQKWAMAPGFEGREHLGMLRRVRRECMFCHNAYPEVPEGSDRYWSPQSLPTELPEGIGCQRCHGPGAEHVRMALSEDFDFQALSASIVNPGDLSPQRRDDVCYECHLQPSVALSGVRRFGVGDYSFRPGESLADYMVPLDVEHLDQEKSESFEINHHPYRLEQSRCYTASIGDDGISALSCLTCHDPHRKVPKEERVAHYRAACQTCHQLDDCDLEAMTSEARSSLPENVKNVDAGNCIACHMQERRPQDVIEVWMTDHLIRRNPGGPELMAPREHGNPIIVDTFFTDPERAPPGDEGEIYRRAAVVRAGGLKALEALESILVRTRPEDLEPYMDLIRGRLQNQQFEEADWVLQQIWHRAEDNPLLLEWRGVVKAGQGKPVEGIAHLRRAIALADDRPEAWFNLGLLFLTIQQPQEALEPFEKALALRDNLPRAWFHQGNALRLLNRNAEAAESFKTALQYAPRYTNAYLGLADALVAHGDPQEALRYVRHGLRVGDEPERLQGALKELEGILARAAVSR